ncbi:hypothetical protein [Xenorhabdus griffiniae]|uniref:5-methyltetrahydropteroyltriglutamate--homocysteine methyltransferase n=1 Tax=Xenorhabdus griffiniae TaxID=351672 RepID=A0ABY9XEU0_9GAMM|nr:hypothetical protein [Xenorhabdus griffiniae]MBD1225995.1 hypothetical protein [Xenorhabdus griffiniae]MBE8585887.1 hypothetical protein [Xenorhabdus griffiniae]WMV71431.1 hypothetical protein QL128_14820 [Xenorhabdus griffiniae]WNH01108.1 hypothetical protein QL112_014825 [Xenorhabdus griffiniae]
MEVYSLEDYIKVYYQGVKAEFARKQGVSPQQVSQWIKQGFIVTKDHKLYSWRRDLIKPLNNNN